jgi:pimeloyl-ACP methyl ester carboxylesterase
MPYAVSEGAKLYYEEAGSGVPVVFVHEFAGDMRSWEPQLRFFSRRYRCIAFNARGYPPSAVPRSASSYSQATAAKDIASVMRHLKIRKAHVVGFSMGAYATLHFGLDHARLALSITVVGLGYGSDPSKREQFMKDNEVMARRFASLGTAAAIKQYQVGPARVQFQNKDPRGFSEFCAQFAEHSAIGAMNTLRGVQARRPTIYELEAGLRRMKVPTHVITGDEDDLALDPSVFIKRVCPSARLSMIAASGHPVNREEPDLFNRLTLDFLTLVDSGRWRARDPRSLGASMMAGK